MSLYKQFRTDKAVEKAGIILRFGLNERTGKPIEIRVARAGGANGGYHKYLEAKTKAHRRAIQTETLEREIGIEIWQDVYAHKVVLGWEGVDFEETENGPAQEDVPFTPENAIRLFKDLPDLFEDLRAQASNWTLFRQDIKEKDAKN